MALSNNSQYIVALIRIFNSILIQYRFCKDPLFWLLMVKLVIIENRQLQTLLFDTSFEFDNNNVI